MKPTCEQVVRDWFKANPRKMKSAYELWKLELSEHKYASYQRACQLLRAENYIYIAHTQEFPYRLRYRKVKE